MKTIDKTLKKKALSRLDTENDSKLETHLNACVRCGLCSTSCMYYLAFREAKYIPAHKVDRVSAVYRRYHTRAGKLLPHLTGARKLTAAYCEEMVDALFGSCTMCGRCVKHCSIGVDIPYVVRKGREMLAEMGLVPETLQSTVDAAIRTGNNMAIPREEFVDTIEWMQEELQDEMSDDTAAIPLDKPDATVFYTLNPREPKFFPLSISAIAKIFYAAKEDWTISSTCYDVTNYGYFNGNLSEATRIARNLYDETHRLRCRRLVLGECGHGSRASRWEGPNYLGKAYDFDTLTAVELIGEYIRRGRITLDRSLNPQPVTIHDPCNLVRNGGLLKEIRFVVGRSAAEIIEMNPCGTENFCCGGGGGMLAMSEYNERRLRIGEIKADQIRRTGARVVVTPCHNCVDQLIQLNHTYQLGVQIKTIAELVADAIIIPKGNEQT